jgi:hypothetical protein
MSSAHYTYSSELAIRVDTNLCAGLTRSLWICMGLTSHFAFPCCLTHLHANRGTWKFITHLLLFIFHHPSLAFHHLTFTFHFLPPTSYLLHPTLAFHLPPSHTPCSSTLLFYFAFHLRFSLSSIIHNHLLMPRQKKAAVAPATPKADSGDEVPPTPATETKKTPRKKAVPKVFHKLSTALSGAAPVDVSFENETVHGKVSEFISN